MDVPNLDTLEQQWRAFLSAPYIIIAPVAFASWVFWWPAHFNCPSNPSIRLSDFIPRR
jgi:hypothetical protein